MKTLRYRPVYWITITADLIFIGLILANYVFAATIPIFILGIAGIAAIVFTALLIAMLYINQSKP